MGEKGKIEATRAICSLPSRFTDFGYGLETM